MGLDIGVKEAYKDKLYADELNLMITVLERLGIVTGDTRGNGSLDTLSGAVDDLTKQNTYVNTGTNNNLVLYRPGVNTVPGEELEKLADGMSFMFHSNNVSDSDCTILLPGVIEKSLKINVTTEVPNKFIVPEALYLAKYDLTNDYFRLFKLGGPNNPNLDVVNNENLTIYTGDGAYNTIDQLVNGSVLHDTAIVYDWLVVELPLNISSENVLIDFTIKRNGILDKETITTGTISMSSDGVDLQNNTSVTMTNGNLNKKLESIPDLTFSTLEIFEQNDVIQLCFRVDKIATDKISIIIDEVKTTETIDQTKWSSDVTITSTNSTANLLTSSNTYFTSPSVEFLPISKDTVRVGGISSINTAGFVQSGNIDPDVTKLPYIITTHANAPSLKALITTRWLVKDFLEKSTPAMFQIAYDLSDLNQPDVYIRTRELDNSAITNWWRVSDARLDVRAYLKDEQIISNVVVPLPPGTLPTIHPNNDNYINKSETITFNGTEGLDKDVLHAGNVITVNSVGGFVGVYDVLAIGTRSTVNLDGGIGVANDSSVIANGGDLAVGSRNTIQGQFVGSKLIGVENNISSLADGEIVGTYTLINPGNNSYVLGGKVKFELLNKTLDASPSNRSAGYYVDVQANTGFDSDNFTMFLGETTGGGKTKGIVLKGCTESLIEGVLKTFTLEIADDVTNDYQIAFQVPNGVQLIKHHPTDINLVTAKKLMIYGRNNTIIDENLDPHIYPDSTIIASDDSITLLPGFKQTPSLFTPKYQMGVLEITTPLTQNGVIDNIPTRTGWKWIKIGRIEDGTSGLVYPFNFGMTLDITASNNPINTAFASITVPTANSSNSDIELSYLGKVKTIGGMVLRRNGDVIVYLDESVIEVVVDIRHNIKTQWDFVTTTIEVLTVEELQAIADEQCTVVSGVGGGGSLGTPNPGDVAQITYSVAKKLESSIENTLDVVISDIGSPVAPELVDVNKGNIAIGYVSAGFQGSLELTLVGTQTNGERWGSLTAIINIGHGTATLNNTNSNQNGREWYKVNSIDGIITTYIGDDVTITITSSTGTTNTKTISGTDDIINHLFRFIYVLGYDSTKERLLILELGVPTATIHYKVRPLSIVGKFEPIDGIEGMTAVNGNALSGYRFAKNKLRTDFPNRPTSRGKRLALEEDLIEVLNRIPPPYDDTAITDRLDLLETASGGGGSATGYDDTALALRVTNMETLVVNSSALVTTVLGGGGGTVDTVARASITALEDGIAGTTLTDNVIFNNGKVTLDLPNAINKTLVAMDNSLLIQGVQFGTIDILVEYGVPIGEYNYVDIIMPLSFVTSNPIVMINISGLTRTNVLLNSNDSPFVDPVTKTSNSFRVYFPEGAIQGNIVKVDWIAMGQTISVT